MLAANKDNAIMIPDGLLNRILLFVAWLCLAVGRGHSLR